MIHGFTQQMKLSSIIRITMKLHTITKDGICPITFKIFYTFELVSL